MAVQLRMPNARVPRIVVPRGRLGLLVVAAAVVPLLYRELVKQGKKLNEERAKRASAKKPTGAAEPSDAKAEPPAAELKEETPRPKSAPKRSVSRNATTKRGKSAGGNPVTSASPAGQEELSASSAAEIQGKATPPTRRRPKRKTTAKTPPSDQPDNPKRTGGSKPS